MKFLTFLVGCLLCSSAFAQKSTKDYGNTNSPHLKDLFQLSHTNGLPATNLNIKYEQLLGDLSNRLSVVSQAYLTSVSNTIVELYGTAARSNAFAFIGSSAGIGTNNHLYTPTVTGVMNTESIAISGVGNLLLNGGAGIAYDSGPDLPELLALDTDGSVIPAATVTLVSSVVRGTNGTMTINNLSSTVVVIENQGGFTNSTILTNIIPAVNGQMLLLINGSTNDIVIGGNVLVQDANNTLYAGFSGTVGGTLFIYFTNAIFSGWVNIGGIPSP